jgi:cytoskeleton protein RodZ
MDIGGQLRSAREARGLSLATLAQRTRVPERALAAIERNDASALPPHPFDRGFVRTYAAEVDLDPDRMVRDYFAQFP